MSAITGCWNFQGKPLDPKILSAMSTPLKHYGLDGENLSFFSEKEEGLSIGLACQHMNLQKENQGERQPLIYEYNHEYKKKNKIALLFDGRLDHRSELQKKLSCPQEISDAAFVLEAYLQWGQDFLRHLIGEFALVLCDFKKKTLFLARDVMGTRPLYYYRDHQVFLFGSEIKAILSHPQVQKKANPNGLIDYLLIGTRPLDDQGETCFQGIYSVPPAHQLEVLRDTQKLNRYWDFDISRSIRFKKFEDYRDGLREVFLQAVSRRMRNAFPVAVSVSGGLDSSSILCSGLSLSPLPCPKLFGVSYITPDGDPADEKIYLTHLEKKYSTQIHRVPFPKNLGVLTGAQEHIQAVEAPFIDFLDEPTRSLHQKARGLGARTVLGGHWGDQILFSYAYLTDFLLSFRWREASQHFKQYKNYFSQEAVQTFKSRLILDTLRYRCPGILLPLLKRIRRKFLRRELSKPYFSKAFQKKINQLAETPILLPKGFHSAQARSIYLEARSKYHVNCMEMNHKGAALHGIEATFPMLDRDLISFLMAIPGEFQAPQGHPRGLFKEAMRGILPDELQKRTWKADFSHFVHSALTQDYEKIIQTLKDDSQLVLHGWITPESLKNELKRTQSQLFLTDECLEAWNIADLVGLELWIQLFLSP